MGLDSVIKGVEQVGEDVDYPHAVKPEKRSRRRDGEDMGYGQYESLVGPAERRSPKSVSGHAIRINPTIDEHAFSTSGTQKGKTDYHEIDDVLVDPDYANFLKYVKKVGKAYAYKSDVPDKRLDYEVADIASDELNHRNLKILKGTSTSYNVQTRRALNEEQRNCTENSNNNLCKRKRPLADEQLKEKAAESQFRCGNNGKRRKVGIEGKKYKLKLRSHSLKKCKRAFPVKEPDDQPIQPSMERRNCTKSDSSIRKRSSADKEVEEKTHQIPQLHIQNNIKRRKFYSEGQDYKSKLRSHLVNEEKSQFHMKEMKDSAAQPSSVRKSRCSGHKVMLEVPSSPKPKGGRKQESEPKDKEYKQFLDCAYLPKEKQILDCAILYHGELVWETESGRKILYFGDNGSSSVSDPRDDSDCDSIIMADSPDQLDCGKDSFVVSKVHHSAENDKERSQFRTILSVKLRNPYDFDEYKFLQKKASERKPVKQHKELRSGAKSYPLLESIGKSYLDHHKDLADKIDSISDDRPRVLNLLRGFFYWLENLLSEGAFKPWKDEACLKILPSS